MRVRHYAVALTTTGLLLTACGGSTDTSGTEADRPTASDIAGETATSEPSVTPEAMPLDEPAADPTPELESIPTVIRLTADDLLDGMPTNKQMSTIQGRTFKELDNWVGGADEGPEWVNDAPLGKRQRNQIGLGSLRIVKPAVCTVVAAIDGEGRSAAQSNRDAITAAGYSKRQNDYFYYKPGNVYTWQTIALVLAPGQAQVWADDFANTRMRCTKYTVVSANGDIERITVGKYFPKGKTMFTSGSVYVEVADLNAENGLPYFDGTLVEAIGDVLYTTEVLFWFDDPKQLAKASKAYNKLADNLATASGVTREPVDLNNLTPFKGDPTKYTPPAEPLSAGNTV